MRFSNSSKIFLVLTTVGILGFGAYAFADWGMGYGHGGRGHHGPGWQRGWSGNQGYQGNLNDEQITRLNKERRTFFEETRNLRENLYQKELELRSELAKEDPDAQKATGLQAEISDLTAQLDQNRIDHRIKMQKENPEFFAGRGYGKGGRGMGRGFHGQGMGQGFRGQGGGGRY